MQLSKHFSLEEMTRSMVAARKGIDNTPGAGEIKNLENVDTSHSHDFIEHDHPVDHDHTKPLVNAKEIELLKVQIEEIKVSTSNPLTN